MACKTALTAIAALLAACGNPHSLSAESGELEKKGEAAAATLRMSVPRAAHLAIPLRDGRILLFGGCVAESCEAGPASGTVDAFDPRTGRFAPAGTMLARRVSTTAVRLPSGEILLAGGWVGSAVSATVEIFDPRKGTSRPAGPLSEARADIAAVTLSDGRILLAGGYGGGAAKSIVEIFDPRTSTLTPAGRLGVPRAGAGAALLKDGRVLIVAGGTNGANGLVPTGAAEIFDSRTGRSERTGGLAQPRYKHATVSLPDGSVLVLGGSDERDAAGKLRSVERFDSTAAAFGSAGDLLEARYKIPDAVVLLPGGKLLVAGGAERAELYDPATFRSEYLGPSFGGRLNFATASLTAGGSVLVAGGYYEDGIRMNDRAWLLAAAAP